MCRSPGRPTANICRSTSSAAAVHSLWILTLENGSIARFTDAPSTEPFGSAFSPDGRWLTYHALPPNASPVTTASGVYVEPFPATGARYQAPKQERDFHPLWSPDGKELMYVPSVSSRRLAITRVSTGSGVTFGDPELIPFNLAGGHLSDEVAGLRCAARRSARGADAARLDRGLPLRDSVRRQLVRRIAEARASEVGIAWQRDWARGRIRAVCTAHTVRSRSDSRWPSQRPSPSSSAPPRPNGRGFSARRQTRCPPCACPTPGRRRQTSSGRPPSRGVAGRRRS